MYKLNNNRLVLYKETKKEEPKKTKGCGKKTKETEKKKK